MQQIATITSPTPTHPDYCAPAHCHREGPDLVHAATPIPAMATRDGDAVPVVVSAERHDEHGGEHGQVYGHTELVVECDGRRLRLDAATVARALGLTLP